MRQTVSKLVCNRRASSVSEILCSSYNIKSYCKDQQIGLVVHDFSQLLRFLNIIGLIAGVSLASSTDAACGNNRPPAVG